MGWLTSENFLDKLLTVTRIHWTQVSFFNMLSDIETQRNKKSSLKGKSLTQPEVLKPISCRIYMSDNI